MDVIDQLHQAVKASKIPLKKIAHDAGMSPYKLSRLLNHKLRRPNIHDVENVVRAIGETMLSLYGGEHDLDVRQALRTLTKFVNQHDARSRGVQPKRPASRTARPFPVAATPNVEILDKEKLRRVRIPDDLWDRGARYAAKAIGDSMIGAGIDDGDIVFFRVSASSRLPLGELVIIRVNTGVYLKRLESDRGKKRLESENDAYKPLLIQPEDEVELYGVLVR